MMKSGWLCLLVSGFGLLACTTGGSTEDLGLSEGLLTKSDGMKPVKRGDACDCDCDDNYEETKPPKKKQPKQPRPDEPPPGVDPAAGEACFRGCMTDPVLLELIKCADGCGTDDSCAEKCFVTCESNDTCIKQLSACDSKCSQFY